MTNLLRAGQFTQPYLIIILFFFIKNVKTVKSSFQAKYKRKINENTIAIFKDNLNNNDWSSVNN